MSVNESPQEDYYSSSSSTSYYDDSGAHSYSSSSFYSYQGSQAQQQAHYSHSNNGYYDYSQNMQSQNSHHHIQHHSQAPQQQSNNQYDYNNYSDENHLYSSPNDYFGESRTPTLPHNQGGTGSGAGLISTKRKSPVFGPGSNKKERRRTQSINNAFASLRDCIPNVPCDTKLSKIKTLRLATSYIDYLITLLNSENSDNILLEGFKVDIHKKWNDKSEDQKRRELEEELNSGGASNRGSNKMVKGGGGRTGWPQHVWALELK
ncbi:HAND2 [Lepeophtheirus salmonis]|uniref:HAND2 n=1 Tax=Lepeophtheirus salmonis TaxID=72036 RepID=A0A0K2UTS5_LEPSM|nr:heart- and neural crest derivatives-expressed protein 2-like [Lepeophtheirus salmonis]CAB4062477.1 HAND2 [Lepeophtheirus salmonis]CAF2903847.1 HAND2 [Lepeophtheirus salmonis]